MEGNLCQENVFENGFCNTFLSAQFSILQDSIFSENSSNTVYFYRVYLTYCFFLLNNVEANAKNYNKEIFNKHQKYIISFLLVKIHKPNVV